ncbi:conserved hypothetical protein, PROLINE RICH; putative membrane anchored protein [Cupriavidus taiwanensis]|uniref:DUF4390 domain-containing protein n=1 Tax=Cupriavidus taiwanensis TaxID=164546 RepID=UPI000E11CFFD|nr:DUF4390 domain-containing protein [Cupriavidus taiwanensis]SOZ13397.1 conserved hypothetical protein, PROLINE RICH; putative membrane anchored protein [Cupriavidus taiwanensis]SOZ20405.1 conserved hypothetical protein, PROLINE RICH; putative membrane anchored protein [Cupriavidus taiwanensis]SOZ41156.1 conserved hypothetical protein, PROLINE RICH; putative membrane anchored protein [Cupriavidus taiwanensis]
MPSTPRLSGFRVEVDLRRTQLARWALALLLALAAALWLPRAAQAQVIEATEARVEYQDGGFELAASFDFDLPPALEDALHKGISLYFAVDFQLSRSRWYWFDDKPVNTTRSVRLSYQPLTRQYRISTGGLQLPFTRLKSALQFIQRVRGWRVFERNAVKPGETYNAEVRMRLDLSQLPKPFQINAVNTRDWNLASDWRRFTYTVPTDLSAPPAPPPQPPAPPPALPASPVLPASPAMPAPAPSRASMPAAANERGLMEGRGLYLQAASYALSPAMLAQPAPSQP